MSRRRSDRKRNPGAGKSKYRKARVLKFSHKNPDSRLAWGGKKKRKEQGPALPQRKV